MARFIKIILTIAMVLVWGWTLFMGIFATHAKGRIVSWIIGISINVLLGIYYSYQISKSKTWKEWLSR